MLPEEFSPLQLESLIAPSDQYTVLSVAQDSELLSDGRLVDTLDISFAVTSRPGVFTVQVALDNPIVRETGLDLTAEAATVEALYAL